MDAKALQALEGLNQLRLTDEERAQTLDFFAAREAEWQAVAAYPTDNVERMVHVQPLVNVLRDDVASQPFSRDDLQAQAPETMDGYWQVPRLVG